MGEIVFSQVGAALGSHLAPNGLTVLGQSLSGAALGQVVGGLAGRAIDASMMAPIHGPRIKSLHVMESREGAGLPLVYGRMRVGGQVIWASRFKEKRRQRAAGKGGPSYVDYAYSVSFAVAIGQGPITRVDRVWANGELLALGEYTWRLYQGTPDQMPDPVIEAIEGAGQAPAYRHTAYIVFEDFPLDAFGQRLPQLSFEVVRAGRSPATSLAGIVEGVNIIPASGEFVYATSIVRERRFPGIERALNMNNSRGEADFALSLEQLQSDLPKVTGAALTVAWFGTDLRAGACKIKPGIERRDRSTVPYAWRVDAYDRESAHLISQSNDSPNYGGTPADEAVLEGLAALNAAGISVTMSPFLLMDVPPGNGLPDPYGGGEQAAFPWRGRIRCDRDQSAQARRDIEAFVGADGGGGYRHFILHHARLAAQAGGVDAILIGSEMRGLTRIRDDQGRFPFIEALIDLAAEVKAIVGGNINVSYAADWTEYGAYSPSDGSGDVLFPLDPLWTSENIDFIGVDWYPPAGDWRDGDTHLDARAGYDSADEPAYILSHLAGGEAYDWYYGSWDDRLAQRRAPITDGAYGEDWIFRQKDLIGWWENPHYERLAGQRRLTPTQWQTKGKPIRIIEIGFPAIDKGPNAPNVFYDPKSSESAVPYFSNGMQDDVIQRRALSAAIPFWRDQEAVEQVLVWAWDGRPWPDFPIRDDVWSDGPNWQFGHWLNGRTGLIELAEVLDDMAEKSDIALETRSANGYVDGYVIDYVTSFANALSPLASAYDFEVRERQDDLSVVSGGQAAAFDLGSAKTISNGDVRTTPLLDKKPSGVSLSYISSDLSYRPAIATQRYRNNDTSFLVQTSLPLVLSEGRAMQIAETQYERVTQADIRRVSVVQDSSVAVEIADRVRFDTVDWRVTRLEDEGGVRHFELQRKGNTSRPARNAVTPTKDSAALVPAKPFFVLIDTYGLSEVEGNGPLIAATANPWRAPVPVYAGHTKTDLTVRASLIEPAGVGVAESQAAIGPATGWDDDNTLEVYVPGEDLSSAEPESVLAGRNRLWVKHQMGWELLSFQRADLLGQDRWRLSRLLRGVRGSAIGETEAGATIVVADDRVIRPVVFPEDAGRPLLWRVGASDNQTFTIQSSG
ncbi:MAG: glycoside hydrolase TIM-barrel-like domain-containing protein [Pseudomonadota bacterium]